MEHLVDELSKVLVDRGSRRRLLRRIGGGLAGAWLVSTLGAEDVSAAPDRCQQICHQQGGGGGPRQAACLQACKKCNADLSRLCGSEFSVICCPTNTSCCSNYNGIACCASGESCCQTYNGGAVCCPTGTVCDGSLGCVTL